MNRPITAIFGQSSDNLRLSTFCSYKKFWLPCTPLKKERGGVFILLKFQRNGTEQTSVSERQIYENYFKFPTRLKRDMKFRNKVHIEMRLPKFIITTLFLKKISRNMKQVWPGCCTTVNSSLPFRINVSITTAIFSQAWKLARVFTIFKVGAWNNPVIMNTLL